MIARQQTVKPGGARTHRAHDHHRAHDPAFEYLGVAFEPFHRGQPVAQHLAELQPRGEFARGIELCLLAQRFEKNGKGLFEPGVAEVGQTGSRCGGIHQGGLFQPGVRHCSNLLPQADGPVQYIDKWRAPRGALNRFLLNLHLASSPLP